MVPTMLMFGMIAAAQQFFQAPVPAQQAFLAPVPMAQAPVVQRPLPFRAAAEKKAMLSMMGQPVQVVDQFTNTVAGVVAVDGGTIGLDVNFGAFLAVFLVTLFIQSDAQGTATSFRQPDSIGGTRYEDE